MRESAVVIDRPRGSLHPRFPEIVYPFDYGYLKGTTAVDGGGVDVWLGSVGRDVTGVVATIDLLKRDVELKLLLGCDSAESTQIHAFHNHGGQVALFLPRPVIPPPG